MTLNTKKAMYLPESTRIGPTLFQYFKYITFSVMFVMIIMAMTSCTSDDADENANTGLILDQSITVDGDEREYHIYVPEQSKQRPLVILLHGNGGNFNQSLGLERTAAPQKVWLSLAEQNDFALLVPNGSIGSSGRRGWNDCRSDADGQTDTDDILFITELLDQVQTAYGFNERKVYVTGVSNGGFMTMRLVFEIPERITAFASVISSLPVNGQCRTSDIPVSALYMNGTDDPITPYTGGQMAFNRGLVLSTQESVDFWVNRNQTSEDAIVTNLPDVDTNDNSAVTKYLYPNGTNNTEVALYQINSGGHTEPSKEERYSNAFRLLVGSQNADIEMAVEVWQFFSDKSR